MASKDKLLITGVSGFLGSWIAKKALETGNYDIVATVQDAKNEERVKILSDAFGDDFNKMTLVSMKLEDEDQVKEAVKGCKYIIHSASPFFLETPGDYKESVLKPAKEGLKNILEQARESGTVERVVYTSSSICVTDQAKGEKTFGPDDYTEENSQMNAYYISKIQGEAYVKEFLKAQEESKDDKLRKIEVVTLCPGVIIGETFLKNIKGAILELFSGFITKTHLDAPQIYAPHTDVQDAAEAHVKAVTMAKANGRYPIAGKTYKYAEYFNWAIKHFEKQGYKLTCSELSACAVWTFSWINKDAKNIYWQWNIKAEMDSSAAENDLEMTFGGDKKAEESVIALCDSLVAKELVKLPAKST